MKVVEVVVVLLVVVVVVMVVEMVVVVVWRWCLQDLQMLSGGEERPADQQLQLPRLEHHGQCLHLPSSSPVSRLLFTCSPPSATT